MVFVSFKMKQILQMLWTSVVGDKKVICALVTERQEDLISVRTLVEAGKLRSIVDRSFPLEQAAEAHRYAESGAKQGSVVISLEPFDVLGTVVFASLAVAVSTLLGRVLEASNRRAYLLEQESHRDARTDSLTGLDNRRAMQERGPLELKRAKRSGEPLSIILGDLDHFKSINDRYGHESGDNALTVVATVLRAALRETDGLARWGGEEFMAILPATHARGANEVAERMRAAIAATTFPRITDGATISLGVATITKVTNLTDAWDNLIKDADQHLYRAKSEGRNRVASESR